MNPVYIEVVAWAAWECEWQQSGSLSVLWMLRGWEWALGMGEITDATIKTLGGLVEPRHNDGNSYRQVDVRVGSSRKGPWQEVPERMTQLVRFATREPDEWFRQYEEIHPFRDGNGRTGNILWNWLRGTLAEPEMPPNLWDDPRRYEGKVRAPVPSPEEE